MASPARGGVTDARVGDGRVLSPPRRRGDSRIARLPHIPTPVIANQCAHWCGNPSPLKLSPQGEGACSAEHCSAAHWGGGLVPHPPRRGDSRIARQSLPQRPWPPLQREVSPMPASVTEGSSPLLAVGTIHESPASCTFPPLSLRASAHTGVAIRFSPSFPAIPTLPPILHLATCRKLW